MSKAYCLFKHLLIAVVLLALLASVWPSAAQGDQTTLTPELKQFLQERIEQPDQAIGRMYPTNALTPTSIQAAPHWLVKASLPAGVAPSLALDSADHPHIVYASEVGIATYYIDGATWQLETLLPSAWWVGTVVVNSQDRPSVTLSGYDELRYYYRDAA